MMKHIKTTLKSGPQVNSSSSSCQELNRSYTLPSIKISNVPHSRAIELYKMPINQVRQKLENNPYVPDEITDSQIVEYLNCTYYDAEKCVDYLTNAFKMMMEMPQLFTNRDVAGPEAVRFWDVVNMAVFPKKSKDGYKIVYFGLKDADPSHFHTVWNMKMYIMVLEAIVRSGDLVPAYIFILDGKGMCFGHVPISQLRFLKKSIGFLQDSSLVNMKKIHFINASSIVERSYSLLRPFLNPNVTESLFFYSDAKMLAKTEEESILPPELGGTLTGDIQQYKEHLRAVVESNAQYFKEDEEKRAKKFSRMRKPSILERKYAEMQGRRID